MKQTELWHINSLKLQNNDRVLLLDCGISFQMLAYTVSYFYMMLTPFCMQIYLLMTDTLSVHLQESDLDFTAPYLSVFVQNVSKESVGVWESLRTSTLPHTHNPVLLGVKHSPL